MKLKIALLLATLLSAPGAVLAGNVSSTGATAVTSSVVVSIMPPTFVVGSSVDSQGATFGPGGPEIGAAPQGSVTEPQIIVIGACIASSFSSC